VSHILLATNSKTEFSGFFPKSNGNFQNGNSRRHYYKSDNKGKAAGGKPTSSCSLIL